MSSHPKIIDAAKKYIDEAYSNESTSNSAKMWNYRAPIYLQIAIKDSELDNDAILKATEAHIKCLQEDKKGRVIVRKWTNKEDIISYLNLDHLPTHLLIDPKGFIYQYPSLPPISLYNDQSIDKLFFDIQKKLEPKKKYNIGSRN